MATAACFVFILAVVLGHSRTVSTNSTAVQSAMSTQNGMVTRKPDIAFVVVCNMQIPTQLVRCILSCAGAVFNGMALALVSKNPDLSKPFRIVLSSLTSADLALAITSVLTGSVAIFDGSAYALGTMKETWEAVRQSSALSTICGLLTGLYHSLLGCSATTTLAMSVDRLIAVFAPVQYRFLGLTGNRISAITLPPWMLALLCVMLLPLSWHYFGNKQPVQQMAKSCWPYVAVKKEFLYFQGVVLLMSVVGVTVAHAIIMHRLSRRAMLVVPVFGPRNADNTDRERRQTRRSAVHAASQALGFCFLYLTLAVYLLVLACPSTDQPLEACKLRFMILTLFPTLNIIINPLLTLWRLQKFPGCRKCISWSNVLSNSQTDAVVSSNNVIETICQRPKPTALTLLEGRAQTRLEDTKQTSSRGTALGLAEEAQQGTSNFRRQSCKERSASGGDYAADIFASQESVPSDRISECDCDAPKDDYSLGNGRANPDLLKSGPE